METKHTPGKWAHEIAGENHWIRAIDDGRTIAFIGGADFIFAQHKGTPHAANAALIARAPDLAAEVERLQVELAAAVEFARQVAAVKVQLADALKAITSDLVEIHRDEIDHDHYGDSTDVAGNGCFYCLDIAKAHAALAAAGR